MPRKSYMHYLVYPIIPKEEQVSSLYSNLLYMCLMVSTKDF